MVHRDHIPIDAYTHTPYGIDGPWPRLATAMMTSPHADDAQKTGHSCRGGEDDGGVGGGGVRPPAGTTFNVVATPRAPSPLNKVQPARCDSLERRGAKSSQHLSLPPPVWCRGEQKQNFLRVRRIKQCFFPTLGLTSLSPQSQPGPDLSCLRAALPYWP